LARVYADDDGGVDNPAEYEDDASKYDATEAAYELGYWKRAVPTCFSRPA